MSEWSAILIAGPTAAGKSALAITLAQAFGGIVINADSMQVYSDLEILTARPGPDDLAAVPHRLFGHVSGSQAYSVGRWLRDAETAIAEVRAAGRIPVVVGGTGLYFRAILEGLSPVPAIPEAIRLRWRETAQRIGGPALHALLAERDPEMAERLRPSDPQRLTRALEVLDSTGQSLAAWQRLSGKPVLHAAAAARFVVCPPRARLWARADDRFDAMMQRGALEEVRALQARGYSTELPVMRALGVAPLGAAVRGEMQLEVAVLTAKRDTRQYIRRQQTWLKRNMISWNWLDEQETERMVRGDFTFMRS